MDFDLSSFGDFLGKIGGIYTETRKIDAQNALITTQARYQSQADQAAAQQQASTSKWLIPVLLLGGGLVLVLVLKK